MADVSANSSPGISRQVAIGAAFMVALRFGFRGIGFISTLILVRLLEPAQFGIVAVAMVAYSVIDILSDLAFDKALIRMEQPEPVHYNTAWTLTILRGIVISVFVVSTAPLLAAFVNEPDIVPMSWAIGAVAVLQSFQNVGMVQFQREMRFDRIFRFQICSKLVGFVVTVSAAFALQNFWALVIGTAAARLILVPLSYVMHSYRPRLSLAAWRSLFGFSKWMLVGNLQGIIDNYSMVFVLGRVGGTTSIGLYQVANEIGALPASEIAAPIRQPLYAAYAQNLPNLRAIADQFLGGLTLTITLLVPCAAGLYLLAEPITALALGEKWMDAQHLIGLCAILALLEAVGHCTFDIFVVLRRQKKLAGLYTLALMLRVPAIILGAYFAGVQGAVIGLLISAAFNMVYLNIHVASLIPFTLRDIVAGTWRTFAAVSVMIPAVWWLATTWVAPADILGAIVRLFSISAIGAVVHIGLLLILWRASGSPRSAESQILAATKEIRIRLETAIAGRLKRI